MLCEADYRAELNSERRLSNMDFFATRLAEPGVVRLVATGRLRDPVLHLLLCDPALGKLPRHRLQAMAAELAEIEARPVVA